MRDTQTQLFCWHDRPVTFPIVFNKAFTQSLQSLVRSLCCDGCKLGHFTRRYPTIISRPNIGSSDAEWCCYFPKYFRTAERSVQSSEAIEDRVQAHDARWDRRRLFSQLRPDHGVGRFEWSDAESTPPRSSRGYENTTDPGIVSTSAAGTSQSSLEINDEKWRDIQLFPVTRGGTSRG